MLSATMIIIVALPLNLIAAAQEVAILMDVDPAHIAMTRLSTQSLVEKSAEALIKKLYTDADGDRETIEAMIISLSIPEHLKGSLAKYWYLNYGTRSNFIWSELDSGGDFILPELDYGFSIEELLAYGKLPAMQKNMFEQKNAQAFLLKN